MPARIDYEFKTDKRGREYALKVNLKTGKKQQVSLKLAKKRSVDSKYRRERVKLEKELEAKNSDYKEYQKAIKQVEKERRRKYKKEKKVVTEKRIKRESKRIALEKRIGIRSRYRYSFKWWTFPCNTPTFQGDGKARDGDWFDEMVDHVNDIYDMVLSVHACPQDIEGGACVVVYRKLDKKVLRQYELGDGCQ